MGWLFFIGILWVLFQFKMAKTILAIGLTAYSVVLLVLAFLLGCFATFFMNHEAMRQWQLASSWVTQIVDSEWFDSNFWIVFFIPFIFVLDVLRWIFQLSLPPQGTIWTFLSLLLGLWGAGRVWYYGLSKFRETTNLARNESAALIEPVRMPEGQPVPHQDLLYSAESYDRGARLAAKLKAWLSTDRPK